MKNKRLEKRLMNFYIFKELLRLQHNYPFDPKKIKRIQEKKLKKIMLRAYEIPLYRKKFEECGMMPSDFRSAEDLDIFPKLTKQEFREWMEENISSNPDKYKDYSVCKTSGTTGIPISILYSPKELAVNSANWIRILKLHGYHPLTDSCMGLRAGYRIPQNGDSIIQKFHILRRNLFNYLLSGEELVDKMNELRPTLLYGHKSKLMQMALVIQSQREDSYRPRLYVPTSEQIDEKSIELFRKVFGDGIFATYGSEETGTCAFGVDNDVTRYCVSCDTHIIRLINDCGKSAQKGRMLITSLFQHEFPVINYDIGDSAELEYVNDIPYLAHLEGRVDDYFCFNNGERVARQPFYAALVKRKEIEQARFIQIDYCSIKIEAVIKQELKYDTERIMSALIGDISQNLNHPEVGFSYQIFDFLPTDANGKIRMMKCLINETKK